MVLRGQRRKTGFTLIELLVVIAIIAILAGILFPVFMSAKMAAQRTKCMNNMKQLGTAMTQYRNDWAGYFPVGGFKVVTTAHASDMTNEWQNVIYRYAKSQQLYRCPACKCPDINWNDLTDLGKNPDNPRTAITYLYNSQLATDITDGQANAVIAPKPHHENVVLRATKCVMLIEGNNFAINKNPFTIGAFYGTDGPGRKQGPWLGDYLFYTRAAPITGGNTGTKSFGLPYHGDGGNVVYVDGHTSYKRWSTNATLEASLPYGASCVPNGQGDPWLK